MRLAVIVAALVALLSAPVPAWAHALLVESDPIDGVELESAPVRVTFVFNEPVSTTAGGGVRVFDTSGERIDEAAGDVDPRAEAVAAPLGDGVDEGTHVATYRVVSADGHPVKGAIVFTIGAAAELDESLLAQLMGDGNGLWGVLAGLGRAVEYAAALAAAGGIVFLARVHRGGAAGERRRLVRIVRGAAAAGIAATVVGVGLQGALVSGLGAAGFVSPSVLGDTLASSYGVAAAARLAGLAALWVSLGDGAAAVSRWVWGGAAAAVASFVLAGHSVTSQPRWLAVGADLLHVAAAAVWFGGLVLLGLVLRARRRDADPAGAAELVAGFSRHATVALAAVVAGGLALGWVEVRALRALVSTPYGWTLLAKLAVVTPILAAGAYNHRRLVPAIASAATVAHPAQEPPVPAGGAGDDLPAPRPSTETGKESASDVTATPTEPETDASADRAWGRLARTVRFEAAGLVAVLAVTAFLAYLQPAADAAGITGVFSTFVPFGPDHELNLVVDPNRAGVNEVHVYVLEASGRPARDLGQELTLRFTKPDEDIGPIERRAQPAGPGHWLHVGPELSIPGRWVVEPVVRVSDFQQLRAQIQVTVNP